MKNRSKKQTGRKNELLTRREMLGAMASAGAFLLLPHTVLSQTLNSGSKQAKKSNATFSVTTRTKDGISIFATAEPNRLAFNVQGPIKPGEGVPLLVTRDVTEQLMVDPKQARQAAKELVAVSESFVEPRLVEIINRSVEGKIRVSFMFLGEEDPDRRIELTVTLKDDKNRVLKRMTKTCSDQRIYAKDHSGRLSRSRGILSMLNSETIEFDLALKEFIRGIEIVFEEI